MFKQLRSWVLMMIVALALSPALVYAAGQPAPEEMARGRLIHCSEKHCLQYDGVEADNEESVEIQIVALGRTKKSYVEVSRCALTIHQSSYRDVLS